MADALLSRFRALIAKVEASYGVDPAPTAAADAVETVGLEVTPLDADWLTLEQDRANLGARAQVAGARRARAKFGAYLAAAGTGDEAPAWGALLRGCGFAQAVTAGTGAGQRNTNALLQAYYGKCDFSPVSAAFESIWLDAFLDRNQHALRGARGTVSLRVDAGALPTLDFEFTGLFVDAETAAARPALDLADWQAPRTVTFAATPTAQLHGEDVVLNKLTISCNNRIEHVDDPGAERVALIDRDVGGSCSIEMPLQSTFDWWARARDGTTGALRVVHGRDGAADADYGAGAIVEINAPKAQLVNPRVGESQGRHMLDFDLRLLPNAATANDELVITTR